MAGMDEVSKQLGELISLSRSTQNQVATLFSKYDKLNEEVIEQRGAIKLLGSQVTEHKADDQKVHKAVAEMAKEFEATKNKGKGLAVGLALVGGGGGAAGLAAALKSFFGGS